MVVADVAAAVVCLGRVVEERVASMADSVDLVYVLERTIRMAVGCCSVLFDPGACSVRHMCSVGEMRMLKPLLAGWKGEVCSF